MVILNSNGMAPAGRGGILQAAAGNRPPQVPPSQGLAPQGSPMFTAPGGLTLRDVLGPLMDQGAAAPAPIVDTGPGPVQYPKISKGQLIAGIIADGLAGAAGQPGRVGAMWQDQRQQADRQHDEEVRWHRDRTAKREDEMRPRIEEVGGSVGMLDPSQQSFHPFYSKSQPFEQYAAAQGYQAGTPEYAQAVEDYRLGSWSDPAVDNRTQFEGVRAEDRNAFEALRAANRMRETNQRLSVTRRGQDLSHGDRVRSQDLAHGDRTRGQDLAASHGGRGRSSGGGDGAVIVNPKTGQRMKLQGGQWVPAT